MYRKILHKHFAKNKLINIILITMVNLRPVLYRDGNWIHLSRLCFVNFLMQTFILNKLKTPTK